MAKRAYLVVDEDMPETLVRDINGDTGERWYRVEGCDAIDEIGNENVQIDGLPKKGDAWSENETTLIVTRMEPKWWTHAKAASTGETVQGVIKVRVQYGVDEARGGGQILPPPKPKNAATKWTSYTTGLKSQQILYGYIPSGVGLVAEPINNGKGMNIEIGTVNLEVVTHYPESHELLLAPLLELANPPKVNENEVETPPLWGSSSKLKFAPGELLYKGHVAEMVESEDGKRVLQVRHQMEAAPNFVYTWQKEDAAGKATDVTLRCNPYLRAAFRGLW